MHRSNRMQPNQNRRHSGFTLIELLVAISIVAILAGLLLTGVQSARRAVDVAAAAQDIRNLDQALTTFHSEFGSYPPSSIVLYERVDEWDAISRRKIQKLWPDYAAGIDLNGNSTTGESGVSLALNGAECLVFFLGGMVASDGAPRGFSRNPVNPFKLDSGERVGPFFEFDLTRLKPTSGGKFAYYDSFPDQQSPIWYLSSYDGRGYDIGDICNTGDNGDLPNGMVDSYKKVVSLVYDDGGKIWYPVGTSEFGAPSWGEQSFQLISPGRDGKYGIGGYYSEGLSDPKQPGWWAGMTMNLQSCIDGIMPLPWGQNYDKFKSDRDRAGDKDNITNFSKGLLN